MDVPNMLEGDSQLPEITDHSRSCAFIGLDQYSVGNAADG
jgi:hypothetical protein